MNRSSMHEDLEDIIDRAAERGAQRALAQIGLVNGEAARDIHELRDLLNAWRSARRIAWQTFIRLMITFLLLALLTGLTIRLRIFGGNQ